MIKRKYLIEWLTLGVVLLFSLVLSGSILEIKVEQAFAATQIKPITINTPTLFVPGTNGKVDRFDGLIEKLTASDSVLKVIVATDGSVTSTGTISSKTQDPMIVIAFEDSSNKTLALQGKWYQQALTYIQERYQFELYNYFGHSNGGLVITSYLEQFQEATDPTVSKIITVGTPYNDVSEEYNSLDTNETEVKEVSGFLKNYLVGIENITPSLEIINVAGEVGNTASDGTVPVQSVFAGKMIYAGQASSYQEVLVKTGQANHSSLVENQSVIKLINEFFYS